MGWHGGGSSEFSPAGVPPASPHHSCSPTWKAFSKILSVFYAPLPGCALHTGRRDSGTAAPRAGPGAPASLVWSGLVSAHCSDIRPSNQTAVPTERSRQPPQALLQWTHKDWLTHLGPAHWTSGRRCRPDRLMRSLPLLNINIEMNCVKLSYRSKMVEYQKKVEYPFHALQPNTLHPVLFILFPKALY